jgi:hypothetical protein
MMSILISREIFELLDSFSYSQDLQLQNTIKDIHTKYQYDLIKILTQF